MGHQLFAYEFAVNDGPFAGTDGKLVTARHIKEGHRETRITSAGGRN